VAGASVTLSLGATVVASGVTGPDGTICFPIATVGNYTITASAPGYQTSSSVYSLTCKDNNVPFNVFVDSDYSCTSDKCCPQAGAPPYAKIGAYPATLIGNDGYGAVTLTRTTISPYPIWTGCAMRRASTAYGAMSWNLNSGPIPVVSDVDVPIFWQLDCRDGWWHLFLTCASCATYYDTPPNLCQGRYPAAGTCGPHECNGGYTGFALKATSCPPAFVVAGPTNGVQTIPTRNDISYVYADNPYVTITQ